MLMLLGETVQGLQLMPSVVAILRGTCGLVTLISMNCFILVRIDPSARSHLIPGCDFIMFPSSHLPSPSSLSGGNRLPWRQDVWKMYETTAPDSVIRYLI